MVGTLRHELGGRLTLGRVFDGVPEPEELLEVVEVKEPPRPQASEVARGAQDVLAALLGN